MCFCLCSSRSPGQTTAAVTVMRTVPKHLRMYPAACLSLSALSPLALCSPHTHTLTLSHSTLPSHSHFLILSRPPTVVVLVFPRPLTSYVLIFHTNARAPRRTRTHSSSHSPLAIFPRPLTPSQVRYDYSKKRVVSEPVELSQEFRCVPRFFCLYVDRDWCC